MKPKRNFKSSMFSCLFSDPDVLRELYCALNGVTLSDDVPVVINTLEDVLFMDQINDISFEIGGRLVVIVEHQSTINPNMALRILLYIARIYEKELDSKTIYSTKKMFIPAPEFFVLYNGTEPYPDESILKLSDMFKSLESLGLPEKVKPVLELEVKVLNINEGKNEAIAKRSKILAEYSAFIAKVREFEKKGNSREAAIKEAVNYCRDHDILKEFLEKNASEVLNMLMVEWNWDDAKQVWQDEAREEGEQIGRDKIIRNMKEKGFSPEQILSVTGVETRREMSP